MAVLPPRTQTPSTALAGHETVAGLLARLRESRARLEAVRPLLPPGLEGAVQAGGLDDTAWTLLVEHAAAAAKLRQCVPALEAALAHAGFAPRALRIKLRSARSR